VPVVVDALAARFGGTAYAAVQVARRMAAERDVVVVTRRGSIVEKGLAGTTAGVVALRDVGHGELVHRMAWEAAGLPRHVPEDAAVLTWSGMLPRPLAARVVSFLANPVPFTGSRPADRLRRRAIRRTRAACLVVPSEGMRDLVEPLLERDVAVVPLGVDAECFAPTPQPGGDILCVADFYRHKRHDLVIEAWARLPAPRPTLRLIGDPRVDPRTHRRVMASVAGASELGRIDVHHRLRLRALVEAYRSARAFVCASEQESFCMPLLEAQACGVPVVTRDMATVRTAGGPSAQYVGGDEPAAWTAALSQLIFDDDAHGAARAAGLRHARALTWEATATALTARLLG
jgi:glycosyltransferase involved in cell wall biosynthesis